MATVKSEETCPASLKIFSWNINGLRSVREEFAEKVAATGANIICIQETKVTRDMLEESVAMLPGFTSYFAFSRRRSGYSGVATFCRLDSTPTQAEEGLTGLLSVNDEVGGTDELDKEFSTEELRTLDSEGRCVVTRHRVDTNSGKERHLVLVNLYCPRADPDREERRDFQLRFYKALDVRANKLRERGDFVVIVGDINCSHKKIDHCDPGEQFGDRPGRRFLDHFLRDYETDRGDGKVSETDISGGKDSETDKGDENDGETDRAGGKEGDEDDDLLSLAWKTEVVSVGAHHFLDSFRLFHPKRRSAFTCWHTALNCRETNYGTRLDYIFIDEALEKHIQESDILPEVMGSDHCPVQAVFRLKTIPSAKPPAAATKYYPEFSGKQQKLSNFFQAADKMAVPTDTADKMSVSTDSQKRSAVTSASGKSDVKKINNSKKFRSEQKSIQSFFKSERIVLENCNTEDNKQKCLSNKSDDCDNTTTARDIPVCLKEKSSNTKNSSSSEAWKALLKGPPPNPKCRHGENCKKLTVTKKGMNLGRQFWACQRGQGREGDPAAKCDFFKWVK